ncbi:flagellar motor switch protein FliN [bacterium]|nr:flagellar motor switch protein FliN [bacterium]
MADDKQEDLGEQEPAGDEASWEDAFREMAEGQEPQPQDALRDSMKGFSPDPQAGAAATALVENGNGGGGRQDPGIGTVDIEFLLDISLDVTVEVGRTKMLIHDLLQLQQGSVIDLDKMVGEPFEVYVNRKLMAYGEVVVVNEKFGIRLTDVIDPKERIQQLA